MPRPRSAISIEAERRYLDGEKLVDIAKCLNKPEGTIRRMKSEQNWDGKKKITERSETITERSDSKPNAKPNARKPVEKIPSLNIAGKRGGNPRPSDAPDEISETNTPHPQARPGNKNAVGNRGGSGGPPGNKNAFVHGAYETIVFDYITDEDELAILAEPLDPQVEMERKAKMHIIRERRMMKQRGTIEQTPGGWIVDNVVKVVGSVGNKPPGTQTTALSINSELLRHDMALNKVAAEGRQTLIALHKMKTGDTGDSGEASASSSHFHETNVTFILPDDGRSKKRGEDNA